MAVERFKLTERMRGALDAYTSEFPRMVDHERWVDQSTPSPTEMAMADRFAKELYEVGEEIRAKQDRYAAIREWMLRYRARYPMANWPIYHPPPQHPEPPKVIKPQKPQFFGEINTSNVAAGDVTFTMTSKELYEKQVVVDKDYTDVTTFGSTEKEYLVTESLLKVSGVTVGHVKAIKQDPMKEGVTITATITDPDFMEFIKKTNDWTWTGPKWSNGAQADSITVDDVKQAADELAYKNTDLSIDKLKAQIAANLKVPTWTKIKHDGE